MKSKDTLLLEQAYRRVYLKENLEQILPGLNFQQVTKKALKYQPFDGSQEQMPAMSYMVVKEPQEVVTITADGKETQNKAESGDVIISGPSKEKYAIKASKFPKLYSGKLGEVITPEQSPRLVAQVNNIQQPITFKAPWGEDMILKPGDYLVKDGDQGYYRIAKKEYEQTYNPIKSSSTNEKLSNTLEQTYQHIYLKEQLLLIEEGKITDFLKKIGGKATNAFLKAKNALTTNPRLMKQFTVASGILLALAAGNTAQAATYGADAVNDLIQQITSASADGTVTTDDLQNIMSNWEQSHKDISVTTSADQLADQAIQSSGDKINKMSSAMSKIGSGGLEGIDAAAKEIGNIAGADKIEDIIGDYDFQIKADYIKNKPSLEEVAKDIASEARYRGFSLEQVKQILSNMNKENISSQTQGNLQKLISLIKF